ncbi:formylglycine-generating enzyme family protein [Acinetobacter calcoaceticus]|uniref:formylglycine-generating enzyme family protein n=1 Tax=Acinetobacter calcoaceticus TaxID=471 RepID=UPI001E2ED555|nr:SUMF1/EgtB/PvdO family nonheme iron enzyme [Acinetobacter calcoaceticus]UGQ28576.1 formylglycine-generating enzyme family protein [Acinetobacter calcoaceticus]
MMKQNIAVVLFSSLALSACAKSTNNTQQIETPTTNQNLSSEQQKKLQQLLDKTKKNLVEIKGGTFMMGDFGEQKSPDKLPYDSDANSKPLHKVTLDTYALSATKATYADFDIYTDVTGQQKIGKFDKFSISERVPTAAAGINWQQAQNYCQWLGKQLNLKMDLPTEAQWEYAARNRGQYILYPTDNGKIDIGRNVWSFKQRQELITKYKADEKIPELQQFPATPLGLYDMITDNYEWMLDWYDPQYYSKSPEKNPKGPAKGTLKVVRSAEPSDGQNLQMFGGFTFSRHAIHPVEDPKLSNDPDIKKYNIDLNRFNSVRCAVTY